MNTKLASRGLVSRFQRILLAILVVLTALGSLPVAKAHAWMYYYVAGKPGAVSVPMVRIGDSLLQTNLGKVLSLKVDSNFQYVFAYRSPATTGDQDVMATYTLELLTTSGWVRFSEQRVYGRIKAGQSYVALPALVLNPSSPLPGTYHITWGFLWATTTGVQLGSTIVVSDRTNDYTCLTTIYRCGINPGYFQISK